MLEKKILLTYVFEPDHEDANTGTARLATCEEAYESLKKDLEDSELDIPELPAPETVTSIEFQLSNTEDWCGSQLAWGDTPMIREVEEAYLRINGVPILLTSQGQPYRQ